MAERTRLGTGTKLGFGVGDLGGNLFFTIMGFYLLFYLTNVVQMQAALAGTALMIGKIWDAVTDPAIGYISDRTQTRWGRRRPYMFGGAILLALFMIILFSTPAIESPALLFIFVVMVYCILNTAYTLVNIPYGALTPELTEDFDERTALNGYRMTFAVVGTFIGAALVIPITNIAPTETAGWTLMGGIMGGIMLLSTFITVWTVREKRAHRVFENSNPFREYFAVLQQKSFLTALVPWALHITGVNIIQGALLYYFQFVHGNEAAFQVALPILLGTTLLFIPIWVRLSLRLGKKLSYNIGMGIVAVASLVLFALGHLYDITFAYGVMLVAGIGLSTNYVMPFSIIPDVVEYDYAERGVRREGVFYGMWTFVSKIGQSIAVGLNGLMLTLFGYVEPSDAIPQPEQSAFTELGIRLLIGPIPTLFFIIGIVVLLFYPITRERYNEIVRGTDERKG